MELARPRIVADNLLLHVRHNFHWERVRRNLRLGMRKRDRGARSQLGGRASCFSRRRMCRRLGVLRRRLVHAKIDWAAARRRKGPPAWSVLRTLTPLHSRGRLFSMSTIPSSSLPMNGLQRPERSISKSEIYRLMSKLGSIGST